MNDLASNTMLDFTQRYVKAPALFVEEVLGVKPLSYQAEFLNDYAKRNVTSRSSYRFTSR